MSGIVFLRSNKIINSGVDTAGLYELLRLHLFAPNADLSVFDEINVVVPTQASGIWLHDRITTDYNVCANVDFVVLLGPILNKIYLANNPGTIISDLENATPLIYKYLCQQRLNTVDAYEINKYLYNENKLDKKRAYFLAGQLHKIFHEYLYIRTNEVLNLDNSSIPLYQRELLNYLFKNQGETKNFLDVYKYFMQVDINKLQLPKNLFIFGLTSIYSSQLQIIKKLANKITIYWYYKTCSFEYYGDLLSDAAKNRLNKKFFKNPELHLDDLYLNEANPLITNLGQQSREFIELLNQNDITVYDFQQHNSSNKLDTYLHILQDDIATLSYRIEKRKRLVDNNSYYKEPITLGYKDDSIKINVCHNKMREVQVMFNEIAELINNGVKAQDILITAPDIDDYSIYINAVFANEFLADKNGNIHQIKCNVTGNRRYTDYAVLEVFSLIINMPYLCPVNYLLEILMSHIIQTSLKINKDDVELIRKWLADNHIYFGFDAKDYAQYGYENYSTHSFKQFLVNIAVGACVSGGGLMDSSLRWNDKDGARNDKNNVWKDKKDCGEDKYYSVAAIVPYDNIDSKQIPLCNKLISLINLLEDVRNTFYIDANNYRDLTIDELHITLDKIEKYLIIEEADLLCSQKFLGKINCFTKVLGDEVKINLPIFNMLYEEYSNEFSKRINLNGYITALSMQYTRNIPYDYVYVLGLNFDTFPRVYEPNILSILSKSWYLADRNYTNEDKQTFLDIFLSTNIKIYFSYIGRSEKDNSEIEPSSVLTEVINVIEESFLDYKSIIEYHSLHPFYKNKAINYSKFWVDVSQQIKPDREIAAANFQLRDYITDGVFLEHFNLTTLDNISNTFLYSNVNLYKALNINTFEHDGELVDIECLSVEDRNIAKELYQCFEQNFATKNVDEILDYAHQKGIIAYGNLGIAQFKKYYDFYRIYAKKRGVKTAINSKVSIGDKVLNINDTIYIEKPASRSSIDINLLDNIKPQSVAWENNSIIITDKFENITEREPNEKNIPYALKIKSLVIKALASKIPELQNYPVILRDMNIEGLYSNYKVELINEDIAVAIYKYYIESYKRPTLIHKGAISKFAETERNPHLIAENTYSSSFNNYELERLKTDFIFAPIAENYFEFTRANNLSNDIIIIGNILSNVSFSKV